MGFRSKDFFVNLCEGRGVRGHVLCPVLTRVDLILHPVVPKAAA
jgi:hypothetical protein